MASDEITEASEEGNTAGVAADEEHGGVARGHGYQEVEIGGGAEREVGEDRPREGGVEVSR